MRAATATERASIDEAYLDITQEASRLLKARGLAACVSLASDSHIAGCGDDEAEVKLDKRTVRMGHRPLGQQAAEAAEGGGEAGAGGGEQGGGAAAASNNPSPAAPTPPAWGGFAPPPSAPASPFAFGEGGAGGGGAGGTHPPHGGQWGENWGEEDWTEEDWAALDAPRSPYSAHPSPLRDGPGEDGGGGGPAAASASCAATTTGAATADAAPAAADPASDAPPVTSSVRRRGGPLSKAWLERPEYLWTEHEKLLVAGAAVVAGAFRSLCASVSSAPSAHFRRDG